MKQVLLVVEKCDTNTFNYPLNPFKVTQKPKLGLDVTEISDR